MFFYQTNLWCGWWATCRESLWRHHPAGARSAWRRRDADAGAERILRPATDKGCNSSQPCRPKEAAWNATVGNESNFICCCWHYYDVTEKYFYCKTPYNCNITIKHWKYFNVTPLGSRSTEKPNNIQYGKSEGDFDHINDNHITFSIIYCKPGGLDLSQRGLDQDSRSRHLQKVSLDSWENLDNFKKLVSTIEISQSRSRNLNFVSTPPSSPKSLNRDRKICRDMKFLANLDSLSQSWSRVSQFYNISRSRFLNFSRFLSLKYLKKSRQILKISTQLNLNWKALILKILTEKKIILSQQ